MTAAFLSLLLWNSDAILSSVDFGIFNHELKSLHSLSGSEARADVRLEGMRVGSVERR